MQTTLLWNIIKILSIVFLLDFVLIFLIGFKFHSEKYKIIIMKIIVWIDMLSLFSISIAFIFVLK